MVSKKEKEHYVIIGISLVIVIVVGIWFLYSGNEAVVGDAVTVTSNVPTLPGTLHVIGQECTPVLSEGQICNDVCEALEKICIPGQDECTTSAEYCVCCRIPA